MNSTPFNPAEIIEIYDIRHKYLGYHPLCSGHINDTYVLEFQTDEGSKHSLLLQRINTNVFKKPVELMQNIVAVTSFLREKIIEEGGDPERETLNVIRTKDGDFLFVDKAGHYWRLYNYIENAYSVDIPEDPKLFYELGKAFGKFQKMLDSFPIDTLHETIPDFHNTKKRYEAFEKAVEENLSGRLENALPEIEFVRARKADASVLVDMIAEGKLPLRVTHNDTKLNNVMFDSESHKSICVVDLDTVMPGLSLYDFGDSIRFGANTAAEDEKDVSKVSLSLPLYTEYVKGYLSEAGNILTPAEVEYLPFSAKLMTYECGMRFLTDFLNGDTYFKTKYPEHNLVRCRTQFALVADMERKMDEMQKITQEEYKKATS